MKMNFENLSKKGTKIIVQSATRDYAKTDYVEGWWGPRTEDGENIPYRTFRKIIKECKFKKIYGGYDNGLISTITKIEII